jgi:histidinol-phosphate aminotransferase
MTKRQLVPEYIQKLKVYQAGKPIDELAREKNLTRITKLASNENPLGPSPFAIKEMTYGLWDTHQYPDMHSYHLKQALAEKYDLSPNNIILGNGSEGIMAYIARAFIQPGDEVLTAENTFIGFYILARGAGSKLVTVPRTPDHRYDVKALAAGITDKTKVIYIANPDNPTGTYISEGEFDYLMEHVPAHVLVILDEAYFEFAKERLDYPDSMNYRYDNVITLRTFSKAYGLAGIRVGYGFAHPYFIENLHKVKLPFEPSIAAQRGAVGALKDTPHLTRTIKNNKKRYIETIAFLRLHGFKPIESITNFIAFETGSEEASDYLFNALLDEGVIIRPLKANEWPEYMRISMGTKEEMLHLFEALEKVMPAYKDKFPMTDAKKTRK